MKKEFYCRDNGGFVELWMRSYYTDEELNKLPFLSRLFNKSVDTRLSYHIYHTHEDFILSCNHYLDNIDYYEDDYNMRQQEIIECQRHQQQLELKARQDEAEKLCKKQQEDKEKQDVLKKIVVRKY